ncbi:MAG: 1-(5-phosphoribosyl)-5-[(5-phosphoribosylamino)methylideneamino]imidazole-4-carboxamide isomerase [bacterium]
MKIIPAIDIIGGRCVRLFQGDYDREESYSDDPVGVAAEWEAQGAQLLHLVDLDGAKDGRPTNRDLVAAIAARVSCPCEIGGGMRQDDQIRWYLDQGLARIVLGSMAITDPQRFQQVCEQFPEKVVLAIDARDGMVAARGWLDTSSLRAEDLLQQVSHLPLAAVQYTDISKDGTLEGPNIDAIRAMAGRSPFTFIAAGGIGSLDHIRELRALDLEIGERIWGVVVGQALYRKAFTLKEAIRISECGFRNAE